MVRYRLIGLVAYRPVCTHRQDAEKGLKGQSDAHRGLKATLISFDLMCGINRVPFRNLGFRSIFQQTARVQPAPRKHTTPSAGEPLNTQVGPRGR